MDFRTPLYFGAKQTTGENGGPGGLFHSLRIIPPILEICEDIVKICPNALLINFSNPMSRICLAVKRKFPSLKFVGLCHEYQHFIPFVSKILGTSASNLELKGGGLNHFGVFLDVKYRDTGKDAYPALRKEGPRYLNSIKGNDGFKLLAYILEKFGYLPYAPDSHFSEYIHWSWEIADVPGIRRFISQYIDYTTAQGIKLQKLIKRGKGARIIKSDDERAIPIIEGILTNSNHIEPSVNIPNDNLITNLPRDLVIEGPATINKEGIIGIELGEYPKGLAALLRNQASVQDLVVETVITKSKDIALQALLVDPVINSSTIAEKILDYMLELQKDYIQLE